jgi:pyruvate-formate lyase-activating enzyme
MFLTLYTNESGEVLEHPQMTMLGRSGSEWVIPEQKEMMPLPRGASLVKIAHHIPVGLDSEDKLGYFELDPADEPRKANAVAALLPQGFTRTLLPACVSTTSQAGLPLLGYAAVGLKDDQVWVAATQTDEHRKWHPRYYNTDGLLSRIRRMLSKYPENRIYRQLVQCSLKYSCFTAQNIFYQRWEGGIPTMRACNAACIGCISENHGEIASPQERIEFTPSSQEISQVASEHLEKAREGIISFGQGCEGEPSLNAVTLADAIRTVRQQTDRGTVNINTNAGYFEGIRTMCDAGLDAMRVTLFSGNEEHYNIYHRPRQYRLADVENSIRYARDRGVKVSINLLTFPGFTDRNDEVESLLSFLERNPVDMIQLRNLNIDPDLLLEHFDTRSEVIGIPGLINLLREELPEVKLGSYTHPHQ